MSNSPSPLRREFTVDKSILASIIKAQSGTVEKALVELATNAIDAGATKLDVLLTLSGFKVSDDGAGFPSIPVFDEFFGRFGFDHSMLDRTYGRFGIGRGQVMALARTEWRTSDFMAAVDIELGGYGYDITPDLEPIVGLTVTGEFYQKLEKSGLNYSSSEFIRLLRYAPIPITLNGFLINEMAGEQWDAETPAALIRANRSYTLDVYSQGILVERVSAHRYGCGGVVVTKRGFALQQNMARAQLLTANCPIWPGIEEIVIRLAKVIAAEDKKRSVQTDASRAAQLAEIMSSNYDDAIDEFMDGKHFTLTDGRHVPIEHISNRKIWTVGEDRTQPAEDLHRAGVAAVLSLRTLDRFGVSRVSDLLRKIKRFASEWEISIHGLHNIEAVENINDVQGFEDPEYTFLSVKDLKKPHKVGLKITQMLSPYVAKLLNKKTRRVVPGRSKSAEAWTDGRNYIAIHEDQLHAAQKDGLQGWMRMVHLLLHEYLHDSASNLSHAHSMEFYEEFHEACFDHSIKLTWVAMHGYRYQCKKGDLTWTKLSALEMYFHVDEEVGEGSLEDPIDHGHRGKSDYRQEAGGSTG